MTDTGGELTGWDIAFSLDADCGFPCEQATATTTVVDDCDNEQFSVEVNVTDLGSSTSLSITNDAMVTATAVTATGTYTVGPFPAGTEVTLTLENDQNTDCSLALGAIQDNCPIAVDYIEVGENPYSTNAGADNNFIPTTFSNGKTQSLILNEELSNLNLGSGTEILGIEWYVVIDNTPNTTTFDLYIDDDVTVSQFSSDGTFTSLSPTLVADDATDSGQSTGWHTVMFDAPFVWDGTDNFAIQMCRSGGGQSVSDKIQLVNTTGNGFVTGYNHTCDAGTGYYSRTNRPFFRLIVASNAPANNLCSTAEALTLGTEVTGDTTNATASGIAAASCGAEGFEQDIWYSFVATAVGQVNIATSADVVVIYDACDGNEIACVGDGATVSSLTNGTTYYVRIYNDGIDESNQARLAGTIALTISESTLSNQNFTSDAALTYYPNPVKNTLTLKAQKEIANVTVFNIIGQQVLENTPNSLNANLDMSKLQAGAYFVKVTVGNAVKTVKIIKK